jgi:hypothetical protein
MTAEELIQEGRALTRPSTFLRKEPSGPVAAWWYPMDYDDYNRTRVRRWVTVDGRFIPSFGLHEPTFLTVFSHERRDDEGRVEVTKCWPEQPGVPLYAYPVSVLPPIDAVFAQGSPAIDHWLSSHGSKRTDDFLSSLDDEAIQGYEEAWRAESPIFASDISAVLGGWHMMWPEGDFNDLLKDQLLIWTLEEPEPWVEVWRTAAGDFKVRQRIT